MIDVTKCLKVQVKTYKQLCIEGIEEYWSGEVDGITINTKVIEFDKNKCKD